jgi:hypothetical protein
MHRRRWLAIAAACGLIGCGPSNGLTMGRITGTITYRGEPVEFGDVLFAPDESKGATGVASMGIIRKDGSYIMSTQESGDGVIAGFHRVGIRVLDPTPVRASPVPEPAPGASTAQEDLAARMARRKAQAPRTRRVHAKEDAPTVSFNGHVYRFIASPKLANPATSGLAVEVSRGSNRIDFAIQEDDSVQVHQR